MLEHLREQRVSYCEHLVQAWGYTYYFTKGMWYSFIHGIYPGYYRSDSTDLIRSMYFDLLTKQKILKED